MGGEVPFHLSWNKQIVKEIVPRDTRMNWEQWRQVEASQRD